MEGREPWTTIFAGLGARGELAICEDREGRDFVELEDGVVVQIVELIGLWWPDFGDQRGQPIFV